MIEYLADGGPYEDSKELYKGIMAILSPNYDDIMELFNEMLSEVAKQVERDTRSAIADEQEDAFWAVYNLNGADQSDEATSRRKVLNELRHLYTVYRDNV